VTILSSISSEIKSHLLAIVVVVLLIGGSVYAVDSLIARHDASTSAKYELLLKQSQATTAADEQAFQTTLAQLSAQNAQLSASIASRDAALATLLKADAQLSAQQAATKLGGTATATGDVDIPLPAARNITAEVDELPIVQSNLATETQIAGNLQTELTKQSVVVADLQAAVPVAQKACNAQIALVNAKARKSKFKWFVAGFITGFGVREVIKP
jgi:hypothetical protein